MEPYPGKRAISRILVVREILEPTQLPIAANGDIHVLDSV